MDEDADADEDAKDVSGGVVRGLLRGLVRKASKATAKMSLGSLPRPKAVAKTAEKLSNAVDIGAKVLQQRADVSEREGKLRRFGVTVLHALPSIAKSSVAGGCLFASYDYVHAGLRASLSSSSVGGEASSDAEETPAMAKGKKADAKADKGVTPSSTSLAVPFVAGLTGGAVHGLVSVSWDRVQAHAPYIAKLTRPSLAGTIASHALLHASLFSFYHVALSALRGYIPTPPPHSYMADTPHSPAVLALDMAAVAVAGAAAGVVAEVVGWYLQPLETSGIRRGLRTAVRLSRPAMRGMLLSAVPSGLGFLAFEYG